MQQPNTAPSQDAPSIFSDGDVEPLHLSDPLLKCIPFGVALPSSESTLNLEKGIVGSIVLLGKKSAMVWVGWGLLEKGSAGLASSEASHNNSFGTGTPTMGQLLVAMPKTNYKGAFGTAGSREASCSQLLGGNCSEDQMLANQMASRLSLRSKMAIYVSCRLSTVHTTSGSHEEDLLSQRAAGFAEREIWKILQTELGTSAQQR